MQDNPTTQIFNAAMFSFAHSDDYAYRTFILYEDMDDVPNASPDMETLRALLSACITVRYRFPIF